jgi:hypothetical protein
VKLASSLLSLVLVLATVSSASAEIIVDGTKPGTFGTQPSIGGQIEGLNVPSNLVVSAPLKADLKEMRYVAVRMAAFPSLINPTASVESYDQKVAAIIASGSVPLFVMPIKPGVANYIGGTSVTNMVALVKRYQVAPYNLTKQIWEVGSTPDIATDYKVGTAAEYSQLFTQTHNALVAAGLRESVRLVGPGISKSYNGQVKGFAEQIMDTFLVQCHDIVDQVSMQTFGSINPNATTTSVQQLNTIGLLDNLFDANRALTLTAGGNDPKANIGVAALINQMKSYTYARGPIRVAFTAKNVAPSHTIEAGLWNLAASDFLLNDRQPISISLDTTATFDLSGQSGNKTGLYNADGSRDFTWWANWMTTHLRGPAVVQPEKVVVPVASNAPGLLVSVTRNFVPRSGTQLFVEVINRTSAPITTPVIINGVNVLSVDKYELSTTTLPNTAVRLSSPVTSGGVTFKPLSGTVLKFNF